MLAPTSALVVWVLEVGKNLPRDLELPSTLIQNEGL